MKIDERLKNGDSSLVNDIANVKINNKNKFFYSFASKYCSHHNAIEFPIYDYFVDRMLWYFQKNDKFSNFKKDDLKDYTIFKRVLNDFKKFYDIDNLIEIGSTIQEDLYRLKTQTKFFSSYSSFNVSEALINVQNKLNILNNINDEIFNEFHDEGLSLDDSTTLEKTSNESKKKVKS